MMDGWMEKQSLFLIARFIPAESYLCQLCLKWTPPG
uniref:Uncharacterized protein n=1 Tax=Anguilla anguilla TaxID=7936 RepID=A0A0E9P7S2_ANGAN